MTQAALRAAVTAVVVALAFALAPARPARADKTSEEAAEHFNLAESAEKRGDWETAVLEYKRAYALKPHPSVLYNIAVDYERLGDFDAAADYFQKYLDGTPDAPDRDDVTNRIRDLRARAQATRQNNGNAGVGQLVVRANVDGASVSIDGQLAGKTPLDVAVPAGPHRIDLTKSGYAPARRDVTVTAGGSQEIREYLAPSGGGGGGSGGTAAGRSRFGFGFLLGAGFGKQSAGRGGVEISLRAASERWELGAFYEKLGPNDTGAGVDMRLLFGHSAFKPYGRVAATLGTASFGLNDYETFGAEAGLGLVYVMSFVQPGAAAQPGAPTIHLGIDYYLEVNGRFTSGGVPSTVDSMPVPEENQTQPLQVSVDLGFVFRF
jgi:hypothetical protein